MNQSRWRPRLFVMVSIVLVLLLGLEVTLLQLGLHPEHGESVDVATNLELMPAPPLEGRDAFAEVEERTLFHWQRRYSPSPTAPGTPAEVATAWQLLGIVGTAQGNMAIFSDSSGQVRVRLREGETASTMRVRHIQPEQVTVVIDGEEKVFPLGKARSAQAATEVGGAEDERIRKLPKNLLTPEMIND
jgi:hypothetical protein